MRPPAGRGDRVRKAAWSALTVVMLLAFLEILARRTDGEQARGYIQMDFDADLMWGLEDEGGVPFPSGLDHAINSLGLRGPELEEGVRVLTLGDSSVYGHGVRVDEVFVGVLASRLNARGASPPVVPVIGGVPGYSSFQARRLLARVGDAVRPDVVVIATVWSDAYRAAISDRAWSEQLAAAYGPWRPVTAALAVVSRRSALARRMRTVLHDTWFPARGKGTEIGWMHLVAPQDGTGGPRGRTPAIDDDASRALPTTRVPLDDYAENLRALAADARGLGALPVFLLLPHPLDGAEVLPPLPQAYRDTLRRVATEERAPLVDAPAWFAAHPAPDRFSDDIHPSAAGHADIATVLEGVVAADAALAARLGIAP